MKVKVMRELYIPDGRISDLLCGALEGGSNYWYRITEYGNPDDISCECRHLELPLSKRGYLMIGDREDDDVTPVRLDRHAMCIGLMKMAGQYQAAFRDFLDENEDGETSDIFLQLCCWGEIVYG